MAGLSTTVEIRLDDESLAAIQALTDALNRMNGGVVASFLDEPEEPIPDEDTEPPKPAGVGATAWET